MSAGHPFPSLREFQRFTALKARAVSEGYDLWRSGAPGTPYAVTRKGVNDALYLGADLDAIADWLDG